MTKEDEILRKLEMIAQLLAMNLFKDMPTTNQIEKLSNLGFKNKEIAIILGKTENTVNVTLSNLRKGKKKSKKSEVLENE